MNKINPDKINPPKTYVVHVDVRVEYHIRAHSASEARAEAELRNFSDGDFVGADDPQVVDEYYE